MDFIINYCEPLSQVQLINNSNTVIDTYDINNLYLQCSIINSSKIIILHWGYSVFINCIPFKNKIFIIQSSNTWFYKQDNFKMCKFYMDYILEHNKVIYF